MAVLLAKTRLTHNFISNRVQSIFLTSILFEWCVMKCQEAVKFKKYVLNTQVHSESASNTHPEI